MRVYIHGVTVAHFQVFAAITGTMYVYTLASYIP